MVDVKAPEPAKQPEPKVEKPVFTKPTSQLDLEARQAAAVQLKKDGGPKPFFKTVNPTGPDDSGFIGTDEIYYGRANSTDLPLDAEGGPVAKAEEDYIKSFEKPEHPKAEKS